MFDLTYKRIRNKSRCGKRGGKQRYSVFRAELNIEDEEYHEMISKFLCDKHDLDLDDFKIDCDRKPWEQTSEHLKIHLSMWPYNKTSLRFLNRRMSDERKQTILRNLETYGSEPNG